jgi:hypothetical protein
VAWPLRDRSGDRIPIAEGESKMMQHKYVAALIVAAGIAVGTAGRAWGAEPSAQPPGGSTTLALTKFYNGSLSSVGDFPGRLVRTGCGWMSTDPAASRCEQPGYALIVDGDTVVHPLLPGTDEVRTQLESSVSRQTAVRVHGRYYSSTGAILANHIAPQCEPSQC